MLADFPGLASLRHFLAFPFSPTGSTACACSRGRFRTDVCPDRRHPAMDHNQRQRSQQSGCALSAWRTWRRAEPVRRFHVRRMGQILHAGAMGPAWCWQNLHEGWPLDRADDDCRAHGPGWRRSCRIPDPASSSEEDHYSRWFLGFHPRCLHGPRKTGPLLRLCGLCPDGELAGGFVCRLRACAWHGACSRQSAGNHRVDRNWPSAVAFTCQLACVSEVGKNLPSEAGDRPSKSRDNQSRIRLARRPGSVCRSR